MVVLRGFDDVTAPDGIDVPGWVCNDPQRRAVTSSKPDQGVSVTLLDIQLGAISDDMIFV